MPYERLDDAARFLAASARVLEYRRFRHLFVAPDADGVLAALGAYATPDGGYGYALEPDGRGPVSQPLHVDLALSVLTEIDRLTEATAAPIIGYLASITCADNGLPAVVPNIAEYPRAPWWAVPDELAGSLIPTANTVGLLHAAGIAHPWLTAATEFCWPRVENLDDTHPYEIINAIAFLDNVPDRPRAEAAAKHLGELVRDRRFVLLDPARPEDAQLPPGYAPGEYMTAVDYAAKPNSLAARWFSPDELRVALAYLAASQANDGGWSAHSLAWTEAVGMEWRGLATLTALITLAAYS
ncbi:MAG TPA: hypothetical protein VGN81_29080 [Pseudonocardiaceae bacterium]